MSQPVKTAMMPKSHIGETISLPVEKHKAIAILLQRCQEERDPALRASARDLVVRLAANL